MMMVIIIIIIIIIILILLLLIIIKMFFTPCLHVGFVSRGRKGNEIRKFDKILETENLTEN